MIAIFLRASPAEPIHEIRLWRRSCTLWSDIICIGSIELEDSQTWLCIQRTRNIVCLSRKMSQWPARCIPHNVYGSRGSPGIDGAKGERVQASVPRLSNQPRLQRRDGERGGSRGCYPRQGTSV